MLTILSPCYRALRASKPRKGRYTSKGCFLVASILSWLKIQAALCFTVQPASAANSSAAKSSLHVTHGWAANSTAAVAGTDIVRASLH